MNRNGNSANFFSYVMAKKIKAASVRRVSSIIVVLNAKLTRLIAAHTNKKARQECRFLLVETHRHLTSIAVLTVPARTSQLYTLQRSYAS